MPPYIGVVGLAERSHFPIPISEPENAGRKIFLKKNLVEIFRVK